VWRVLFYLGAGSYFFVLFGGSHLFKAYQPTLFGHLFDFVALSPMFVFRGSVRLSSHTNENTPILMVLRFLIVFAIVYSFLWFFFLAVVLSVGGAFPRSFLWGVGSSVFQFFFVLCLFFCLVFVKQLSLFGLVFSPFSTIALQSAFWVDSFAFGCQFFFLSFFHLFGHPAFYPWDTFHQTFFPPAFPPPNPKPTLSSAHPWVFRCRVPTLRSFWVFGRFCFCFFLEVFPPFLL